MRKKKIDVVNIVLTLMFIVVAIAVIYPFYSSILISFMKEKELFANPIPIVVKEPTLAAYKKIFSDAKILNGYKNVFLLIIGVVPLHMIVNTSMAYALSRKRFLFSKLINNSDISNRALLCIVPNFVCCYFPNASLSTKSVPKAKWVKIIVKSEKRG